MARVADAFEGQLRCFDVPADAADRDRKVSGTTRDTWDDDRAAFVVRDDNYVSARWPGDVHTFARLFARVLTEHTAQTGKASCNVTPSFD
jgi:hypothetical protein